MGQIQLPSCGSSSSSIRCLGTGQYQIRRRLRREYVQAGNQRVEGIPELSGALAAPGLNVSDETVVQIELDDKTRLECYVLGGRQIMLTGRAVFTIDGSSTDPFFDRFSAIGSQRIALGLGPSLDRAPHSAVNTRHYATTRE